MNPLRKDDFNQNRRRGDLRTRANCLLVNNQKSTDKKDFSRKGLFRAESLLNTAYLPVARIRFLFHHS
ncbi:MAG: hypothetical protein JJU02_07345 [Cryomorphaceae bacterium]|nr:hypothetical protein [Cryomorphaceae bacterium]